jgi:hypothetical protein
MHCYGWGCELVDDDLVVVEELDGCGEGYSLPEHLLQVSELLFALDHKKGLFSSIKNGTVHCRPRRVSTTEAQILWRLGLSGRHTYTGSSCPCLHEDSTSHHRMSIAKLPLVFFTTTKRF